MKPAPYRRYFTSFFFMLCALPFPGKANEFPEDSEKIPADESSFSQHQLGLDASIFSPGLHYGHRISGTWFAGAAAGLGGDFLNIMLISGAHFSESFGLS